MQDTVVFIDGQALDFMRHNLEMWRINYKALFSLLVYVIAGGNDRLARPPVYVANKHFLTNLAGTLNDLGYETVPRDPPHDDDGFIISSITSLPESVKRIIIVAADGDFQLALAASSREVTVVATMRQSSQQKGTSLGNLMREKIARGDYKFVDLFDYKGELEYKLLNRTPERSVRRVAGFKGLNLEIAPPAEANGKARTTTALVELKGNASIIRRFLDELSEAAAPHPTVSLTIIEEGEK